MECPKCHSNNVQVQAKQTKVSLTTGFTLFFGGLGLMFLGIIGLIVGVVLGLIVGVIANNFVPPKIESYAVCQDCGHSYKIKK